MLVQFINHLFIVSLFYLIIRCLLFIIYCLLFQCYSHVVIVQGLSCQYLFGLLLYLLAFYGLNFVFLSVLRASYFLSFIVSFLLFVIILCYRNFFLFSGCKKVTSEFYSFFTLLSFSFIHSISNFL